MKRTTHRASQLTAAIVAAVLCVLLAAAGQAAKPKTATGHKAQVEAVLALCDGR